MLDYLLEYQPLRHINTCSKASPTTSTPYPSHSWSKSCILGRFCRRGQDKAVCKAVCKKAVCKKAVCKTEQFAALELKSSRRHPRPLAPTLGRESSSPLSCIILAFVPLFAYRNYLVVTYLKTSKFACCTNPALK